MTRKELLLRVEEIIEAEPNSLIGDEALIELNGWDSLAVVSFIAMVSEEFDITLSASKIQSAVKVSDLLNLLNDRLS